MQTSIPLIPPIDSIAGLLGWALAIVLTGMIIIWRLREKDRAVAEAKLEAARSEQMGALKAMLADREATIVRLGDKLDKVREAGEKKLEESQNAHRSDLERAAKAIARRSSPDQAMRGAEQWEELPTGMKPVLDLIAQALRPPPKPTDPFPELEEWTPSREGLPRSRGKLPSR